MIEMGGSVLLRFILEDINFETLINLMFIYHKTNNLIFFSRTLGTDQNKQSKHNTVFDWPLTFRSLPSLRHTNMTLL